VQARPLPLAWPHALLPAAAQRCGRARGDLAQCSVHGADNTGAVCKPLLLLAGPGSRPLCM